MRTRLLLFTAIAVLSCGGPPKVDPGNTPVPAKTTISPEPGPFNGSVDVTLTSEPAATIYYSTDGADPTVEGASRKVGKSPVSFTLNQTTTVKYYSRTDQGADESVSSATYVRAGGAPGTISGVVVVGTVAVGKQMELTVNGSGQTLNAVNVPSEVPFSLTGLAEGTYRLRALADRNDDGQLFPFIDFMSDVVTVELDFADPFKASAEGVRIYLGTSQSGLGTLKGTVTFAKPPSGQSLSIAALDPGALGAGADPAALLAQLQSGYQVFTNSTDTTYSYVITDLKPGSYAPVAILTGFGNGGLAMNFQGNPLNSVSIVADETKTRDFVFGGVGITGNATFDPAPTDGGTPPDGGIPGFAYGVVAAKTFSLSAGFQAVLMPTIFTPNGQGTQLNGGYGGTALRENAQFALRAFPNTNDPNPLITALGWVVAVLNAAPPHANVGTGTTDIIVNFSF